MSRLLYCCVALALLFTACSTGTNTLVVYSAGACLDLDTNLTGLVEDNPATIPCDEPHEFEVAAHVELPEDREWPGEREMVLLAREECFPRIEEYVGAPILQAGLWGKQLRPTEESWELGDRGIDCILQTPGPVTFSVEGLGATDPLVSSDGLMVPFQLQQGDCVVAESSLNETFVQRIDCSEPHTVEVVLVEPLSPDASGGFPGEDVSADFAEATCTEAFANWVGTPWFESSLDYDYLRPTADYWALGGRRVTCLVLSQDELSTSARGSGL